jgi:hypothetical protein
MTDDVAPAPAPEAAHCGWCSAELPSRTVTECPSCGATLVGEGEPQVPGVTALDADAIIRGKRPIPRPRSRLLAWISGDEAEPEGGSPATPGSLAPPPPEVAAEMLRLEIAAEVADLEAEAGSLAAEAELEAREAGLVPASEATDGNDAATAGATDEVATPPTAPPATERAPGSAGTTPPA